TWELDAELVVLSACESGLGVAAGGEGDLGFAPPPFAKGARSLGLSLWEGDDRAPAPVVTRFYQGLPGRPARPTGPPPHAAAPRPPDGPAAEGRGAGRGQALAAGAEGRRGRRRARRAGAWPRAPPGQGRWPGPARSVVRTRADRRAAVRPPVLLGLVHPDRRP